MRSLVLFLLFLIGLYYVRRALRRLRGDSRAPDLPPAPADDPHRAEAMVACAHCGLHVPESEAVVGAAGRAFCSDEHRRLGAR